LLNVGQDKITLRNERKAVSIKIKPRISCNHMSSVITAAALGAGVAVVPSYLVKEHLKSGSLIRILPKWNGPKFPVSVVSPTSMSSSSRISILINEIIAECRQTFES
jgi:DNA-binding transcriptional LysR family regulator